MNAVGLGDQAEQRTVAVETPGAADGGDFDAGLAVAVEDFVAEAASGIAVGEGDGHISVPLYIHHRDEGIGEDTLHRCPPCQLLQFCHRTPMSLLMQISS